MFRKLLCCQICVASERDIKDVYLSHNLLIEIPAEVFYYERTLENLHLDCNHISELPRQLFNCDELKMLDLSDNEIGFLPPAVSSLIHLTKLNLNKNSIRSIPENIRNCRSLTVLNLSVNPLEKFPETLINVLTLNELYLNDTYLEFLPANFGKLIHLRILELRENNLSALPPTMNRLIHLSRLDLGNNEFSELPEVVSSLVNLHELWIDGNHIRKFSASIGQLRKLLHFEASNNLIEYLPRDIGYWTRVCDFSVSNNELNTIPTTVANMKNLINLRLDENSITTLPDTIGKLHHLEELNLAYNYLTHLPSSIGLLRRLHVLTLDKNYLSSLPPELGSCSSLSILSVRGNRLHEIPAEIGHLSGLRVLNFVDNYIKNLPMSLLKLNKLSALWLSNNQSQPLVPLQQEKLATNQNVLTCFMLPQTKHSAKTESRVQESTVPTKSQDRHIYFASDAKLKIEQPGRLTRAPTPYPKELRALAKHAKSVQRGLMVSQYRTNEPAAHPVQEPVQIKEAIVTATPHKTSIEIDESIKLDQLSSTYPVENNYELENTISNLYDVKKSNTLGQPVLALDSSPVIREAKNIRTDTQKHTSLTIMDDIVMPKPPPYHIAAMHSVKAQYFNAPNNEHLLTEGFNNRKSSATFTRHELDESKSFLMLEHSKMIDATSSRAELNDSKILGFVRTDSNETDVIINTDNGFDHSFIRAETEYSHISDDRREYSMINCYKSNQAYKIDNINCDTENNFVIDTTDDEISQNDYKPMTFIQDKPSPGQNIVAPTPKRPSTKIPHIRISPSEKHSTDLIIPSANYNNTSPNQSPYLNRSVPTRDISTNTPIHNNKHLPTKIPVLFKNLPSNISSKWLFGQHKNATVLQVTVHKSPTLGFTISENTGKGLYVESVTTCGALNIGDKILEVEEIDFTKISKSRAMQILNNCGPTINMMISHIK